MSLEALAGAPTGFGQTIGPASLAPPQPTPPREMNLKERVMTQDQRISLLEQQVSELTAMVKELAERCIHQLGLEVR